MERALTETLAPARNAGVMAARSVADERATWALGLFRDADTFAHTSPDGEGLAVTGRVTGLPWRESETRFLHLGLAASWRRTDEGTVAYRQRPEAHLLPNFVSTGNVALDGRVRLLGVEVAIVRDRFSFQGEWTRSALPVAGAADARLGAAYLAATWCFTGESRGYRAGEGVFGRLAPRRSFLGSADRGPGAWELGVRWSRADLDDATVAGGTLRDLTLGLSWYLDRRTRFTCNLVSADLEGAGRAAVLQGRFQVVF
jgi:phosphate-selective porin OprO/OprP